LASLKGLSALAAGGVLILAACGGDQGEQEPFTPVPAETPAQPAEGEGTPGSGNGQTPGIDNGQTPGADNGQTPGADNGQAAETPSGMEQPTESPAGQEEPAGEQPTGEQPGMTDGVEAMAVVDIGGQLMVLTGGQCTWTEGTAGQTVAGQPGDGSVVRLSFDAQAGTEQPSESPDPAASPDTDTQTPDPAATPGTDAQSPGPDAGQPGIGGQATLELSFELTSRFAPPAEEPAGEQPGRDLSAEEVLPFIVQPESVELSVQAEGRNVGELQISAGSVAPNGLSGYVVALTQDEQLLTVNYLCTTGQEDAGMPTESPDPAASPDAAESPAIDDNGLESPAP